MGVSFEVLFRPLLAPLFFLFLQRNTQAIVAAFQLAPFFVSIANSLVFSKPAFMSAFLAF